MTPGVSLSGSLGLFFPFEGGGGYGGEGWGCKTAVFRIEELRLSFFWLRAVGLRAVKFESQS